MHDEEIEQPSYDGNQSYYIGPAKAGHGLLSSLRRIFTFMIDPFRWRYVSPYRHLSEEFNHFATPDRAVTHRELARTTPHTNNKIGQPVIWAYIGLDDPTRGDSRGYTGLARRMAELMDGRMVYVDVAALREKTGDLDVRKLSGAVRKFAAADGHPDVILGTNSPDVIKADLRPTMLVSSYNEMLVPSRSKLVSHDLTPDMLAEAGKQFRKIYPNLPGKLFGVMLSYPRDQAEIKAIEYVADACVHYPQSTIFLCPSRRTDRYRYQEVVSRLHERLNTLGITDRVHIETPSFNTMRDGYNPYRGLIDQADHMALLGESHSMVSETICAGRPLYLHEKTARPYAHLRKLGYVRSLNMTSPDAPLPEDRLDPIDITTTVAQKLVSEFNRLARLRAIASNDNAAQQPVLRLQNRPTAAPR